MGFSISPSGYLSSSKSPPVASSFSGLNLASRVPFRPAAERKLFRKREREGEIERKRGGRVREGEGAEPEPVLGVDLGFRVNMGL